MKSFISWLLAIILLNFTSQAQSWSKLGTGSSGFNTIGEGIYSICSDNHNNIYAAGWLNDSSLNQVVSKWNGASWSRLGVGSSVLNLFNDITQIIADTSGNVYVVGQSFSSSGNVVAKWNGSTWSSLGAFSFNGQILTACLDRFGNLYAAGCFTDTLSDTVSKTCVAKWNGSSWSELGTGIHALNGNNVINTLCTDSAGNVYAAGVFTDSATSLGGNLYVAKWNGTSWSELGAGVAHQVFGDYQIFSIIADPAGNIYAAGIFGPDHVMKWNGVSWSAVGAGSDSLFHSDAIFSICMDVYGNLYAAGRIREAISGNRFVARWNGTIWSELGTGTNALSANEDVQSICSDGNGNIYAGGIFTDTSISLLVDTTYYHPFYVAKYTNPTTSVAPVRNLSADVSVYPNPANDLVIIYAKNAKTSQVRFLDVKGSVVSVYAPPASAETLTISVKDMPNGVYIMQLQTSVGMVARKLVVAR